MWQYRGITFNMKCAYTAECFTSLLLVIGPFISNPPNEKWVKKPLDSLYSPVRNDLTYFKGQKLKNKINVIFTSYR